MKKIIIWVFLFFVWFNISDAVWETYSPSFNGSTFYWDAYWDKYYWTSYNDSILRVSDWTSLSLPWWVFRKFAFYWDYVYYQTSSSVYKYNMVTEENTFLFSWWNSNGWISFVNSDYIISNWNNLYVYDHSWNLIKNIPYLGNQFSGEPWVGFYNDVIYYPYAAGVNSWDRYIWRYDLNTNLNTQFAFRSWSSGFSVTNMWDYWLMQDWRYFDFETETFYNYADWAIWTNNFGNIWDIIYASSTWGTWIYTSDSLWVFNFSLPVNLTCETITVNDKYAINLNFWTWTVIWQSDDFINIKDWLNELSIINSKSFSGQIVPVINWIWIFESEVQAFTRWYPVYRFYKEDWIDTFIVDWDWDFDPFDTSAETNPFLKYYKVSDCTASDFVNPQLDISIYILKNTHFEFWKQYSLPKQYKNMCFTFFLDYFSTLQLTKLNIWLNNWVTTSSKELCSDSETWEVTIDWVSYTWSLSNLWDNTIQIYNKTLKDISNSTYIWGIENTDIYDIDWDWQVSINEATTWLMWYIRNFFSNLADMVESIKKFLTEIWKLWDEVEQKDFLSFLIPTTHAWNNIIDTVMVKASKTKMDTMPILKNTYNMFYYLLFTVLFLTFFWILYSLRK